MLSAAPVIVGLSRHVVPALLLRGRVRLTARSIELDTRRCLGCGAAHPYPMACAIVDHDGDVRPTVRRVSACWVACQPMQQSVPSGAGRGGPFL